MAFTEKQNEMIRNDLIKEAKKCAVSVGMRKTSVDQLTEAVGISKGSFYKFFDSKELLFFTVLEDIHSECFNVAEKSLKNSVSLPRVERAAEAILAVSLRLSKTKAFVFIENDLDYLLRMLPEDVKKAHYHGDDTHIQTILKENELISKEKMPLASATIRAIFLTIPHQGQIGTHYPEVLKTLVYGACKELFS